MSVAKMVGNDPTRLLARRQGIGALDENPLLDGGKVDGVQLSAVVVSKSEQDEGTAHAVLNTGLDEDSRLRDAGDEVQQTPVSAHVVDPIELLPRELRYAPDLVIDRGEKRPIVIQVRPVAANDLLVDVPEVCQLRKVVF